MRLASWTIVIVALVGANASVAHHSISMFEIGTPIWVKGTVVDYQPINPHVMIVLEETAADGSAWRWTIEGPAARRASGTQIGALAGMQLGADFLKPGDAIEVCGFPPKAEFVRESATSRGYLPSVIHGQVLKIPDGQMRRWGPYGKLANCIRDGDDAQTWIDFVNTDPLARDAWCASPNFIRFPTLPPQDFIDEVNSRMNDPCD